MDNLPDGGWKFDGGKPRMDLLCPFAMEELAKVLTFGAKKYDEWNWSKGIKTGRLIAAALRHLFAYARGEDRDPETGLHHVAHAMCCCMFIVGMPHYVDGQDDRLLRLSTTGATNENENQLEIQFPQNDFTKGEGTARIARCVVRLKNYRPKELTYKYDICQNCGRTGHGTSCTKA